MKQIPSSFRHFSVVSGKASMRTPNAASTSELPVLLVTPRFPCLATGTPAPATTNAAAVETLKDFARLDPVPAVSRKDSYLALMRNAFALIAVAQPTNSSTVSPLFAHAARAAAITSSVAVSDNKQFTRSAASSRERLSACVKRDVRLRNFGSVRDIVSLSVVVMIDKVR